MRGEEEHPAARVPARQRVLLLEPCDPDVQVGRGGVSGVMEAIEQGAGAEERNGQAPLEPLRRTARHLQREERVLDLRQLPGEEDVDVLLDFRLVAEPPIVGPEGGEE